MTHPLPDPMSRYREDGGPAFAPNGAPHPTDPTKAVYGMSLRDYFAGQAMAAIIAKAPLMGAGPVFSTDEHITLSDDVAAFRVREIAKGAYDYADAMLAERSR